MECSKCGGKIKVVKTRTNVNEVYRYRRCLNCGRKLYTIEQITDSLNVCDKINEINKRYL